MKIAATAPFLIQAAARLRDDVAHLSFSPPVACVYNPLDYAWQTHEAYLRRYGEGRKRIIFIGMNPGPWGMVQTGIPFGEVAVVRDWLQIEAHIAAPKRAHPKRPVSGFACKRSEVSGKRLWGLFQNRFKTPEAFFADHLVANFCPLAFVEESGRNRTPDKLPTREVQPLYDRCERHLKAIADALDPEWIIGIGGFAHDRVREALNNRNIRTARILHPSPASPTANRDWARAATCQLVEIGAWHK